MTMRFTGWHFAALMIAFFGTVAAVNFFMASRAVGSFGGVVVENTYVESQRFNDYLDAAERQNRLGWKAEVGRSGDGRLAVATQGAPAGLAGTAELRRPLGSVETVSLALVSDEGGRLLSTQRIPEGRWLARVTLTDGVREMRIERPVG